MSSGHDIDGSLATWREVEPTHAWDTLLTGNGLSVNVWPAFDYRSLYEQATAGDGLARLSASDQILFRQLTRSTNFERVLASVRTAIQVARACGEDAHALEARYRKIRAVLGAAVRAAHVERIDVPEQTLNRIRRALLAFDWVFTTSYDLIVYWAMGHGETFDGFCDCMWSNGRNEFDVARTAIRPGVTPVLFLHGALHLIVQGDGTTRKLRRNDRALLEQFGEPIAGDSGAGPLLVSEGAYEDKVAAIEANEYLSFGLGELRRQTSPVVVFGHGLGPQDQHLVHALNEHPARPVAVSIFPDSRARVRARQGHVRALLETEQLYFYDSTTHPLGAPDLRAQASRGVLQRAHAIG